MAKLGGIDWLNKQVISGTYKAVAADDSAGYVLLDTGQPAASGFIVQIYRSSVVNGSDVKVSMTNGVLKVEDGSTYKVTADDIINWMVF